MKKIYILLLLLTNFLFASIGQITAIVGDVQITRDSNQIKAQLGTLLEKSDIINSLKASRAQITMNDNTIISIGQNSTLNIFDYFYDDKKLSESRASIGFMKGTFKSITGAIGKINKEKFKLRTKSATIGIRGTTIIGNQEIIICTDGAITVTANNIPVLVEKQEFTRTILGKAPTSPETVTKSTLHTVEQELNAESTTPNDKGEDILPDVEKDDGNDDELETQPINKISGTTPVEEVVQETNEEAVQDKVSDVSNQISTVSSVKNLKDYKLEGFDYVGYMGVNLYNNGSIESTSSGFIGITYNELDPTKSSFNIHLPNKTFINGNALYSNDSIVKDDKNNIILIGGIWDSENFNDSPMNGYNGVWLAGVQTSTNIMDNLRLGSLERLSYTGEVLAGSIVDSSLNTHPIDTGFNNNVSLNFDFGGGVNSFSGEINVAYVSDSLTGTFKEVNIKIGSNGSNISSNGFTSNNVSVGEGSFGTLTGTHLGENLDILIGKVDVNDPTHNSGIDSAGLLIKATKN